MLVSQPKTSITLTQAVCLPLVEYLSYPKSLTVFKDRPFLVQ
jgi:hypothetical protein